MNRVLALLIIAGVAIAANNAIRDKRAGLGAFSSKENSKISKAYLTKSVRGRKPYEVGPGSKKLENGSANVVTSVVVDYRGFDTLGEVTVLFTAAAGIGLLFGRRRRIKLERPSAVVRTIAPWALFFILLVGAYIFLHGHLTPGGGFPGGAMIAAGAALMLMSIRPKIKHIYLKVLESLAGITFVSMGLIGLFKKGSFLQNFMTNGTLGATFSVYFIMIIYFAVGIKVASELSSVVGEFDEMEENGGNE